MRLIIAAIGLLVFCFALALPATGAGEAIRWTEEEQAFLAKDLTIIVGGEMDWPPLDFVEDGVYQGVAKDYLDQISTLTGLRFEITTGHTWSELLTMISEKEIDMVPMMYWSEQRGRDFNLTSPFITVRHYAFAKDTSPKFRSLSDLSGYSVAIPSGYASIDHIDQHYPDINIIEVGTVIEAIDSVLTGKADVVIENTASIAYYTKQQNIVGLVPAFPIKFEINDVQMAVRQDLPILRDILQKGLDQISVPKATEIMQRWTDSENSAKNFLTEQLVLTGIQKEYAEKKAHLVACVNAAMAPFEAYNRGRHEGVAADYLELISKSFGAPARLVPVGSWDEAKGHLQSG